jgi:hypothetical protein
MIVQGCKHVFGLGLVQILADEPVKFFWDPPSVSICGASEPFHGLVHAIGPEEVLSLVIVPE